MKPAYHIALEPAERRLIADIALIQSQIEWLMRLTVQYLLDLTPEAARQIMGSTSIEANVTNWVMIVREKHPDSDARSWAEYAFTQMKILAGSRNDFLHTLYGLATAGQFQGDTSFMYAHRASKRRAVGQRRAIRVKNLKEAPLHLLEKVRDDLAYLSIVFAHIERQANTAPVGRSPWPRRLATRPRPQPKPAAPAQAKGPKSPPRS